MKRSLRKTSVLMLGLAMPLSFASCSTLTTRDPAGQRASIEYRAPDGATEEASLLVPFPIIPPDVKVGSSGFSNSKNWYRDEDAKDIQKLAEIDLYTQDAERAVGVFAKLHNTYPALEILSVPKGLNKATYERTNARKVDDAREGKKLAKFKTSLFGSESQSARAYYHLSRILGYVVNVPAATFRTVSAKLHRKVIGDALSSDIKGDLRDAYGYLRERHDDPSNSARYRIFPSGNANVVYGTLAENPKGESELELMNGILGRATEKAMSIRSREFYQHASSMQPISRMLDLRRGSPNYVANLQKLAYAQDFVDAILLDYTFRQADRFGNFHKKTYFHYIDEDGRLGWKKDVQEIQGPSIKLDRVMLKDNDDAFDWNRGSGTSIENARLFEDVHHMNPVTFRRIRWLSNQMRLDKSAAVIRDYFVNQVRISPANYDAMRERIIQVANYLQAKYERHQLLLDLDLESAIKGQTVDPFSVPVKPR